MAGTCICTLSVWLNWRGCGLILTKGLASVLIGYYPATPSLMSGTRLPRRTLPDGSEEIDWTCIGVDGLVDAEPYVLKAGQWAVHHPLLPHMSGPVRTDPCARRNHCDPADPSATATRPVLVLRFQRGAPPVVRVHTHNPIQNASTSIHS